MSERFHASHEARNQGPEKPHTGPATWSPSAAPLCREILLAIENAIAANHAPGGSHDLREPKLSLSK